jgi:hypothetical protein
LTSFPWPTDAFQAGSTAERNFVKPSVVPDESERWTTVMELLGKLRPGFSALIAGALQVLILPVKMPASAVPSSLSPLLTPDRLYDTVIPPSATGNWRTGPLNFALSVGLSAGSLPAKSTVLP